jgi:hypothetical protein
MAWISHTGDSIANMAATDYGTIPFGKFKLGIPIILMNIIIKLCKRSVSDFGSACHGARSTAEATAGDRVRHLGI